MHEKEMAINEGQVANKNRIAGIHKQRTFSFGHTYYILAENLFFAIA
jgi:hypothetical protein